MWGKTVELTLKWNNKTLKHIKFSTTFCDYRKLHRFKQYKLNIIISIHRSIFPQSFASRFSAKFEISLRQCFLSWDRKQTNLSFIIVYQAKYSRKKMLNLLPKFVLRLPVRTGRDGWQNDTIFKQISIIYLSFVSRSLTIFEISRGQHLKKES